MNTYAILADVVVILHLGYVAFVVLGLAAILIGRLFKWRWIRNSWFRVIHLSMIAIVVVESLMSITCPLTTLEHWLRGQAGQTLQAGSFMGKLAQDILFYEFTPEFFTVAYCLFGSLVLLTFILIPPRFTAIGVLRRFNE